MAILVNQNLGVRAGVVGEVLGLHIFSIKSYLLWTPFLNGTNLNSKIGGEMMHPNEQHISCQDRHSDMVRFSCCGQFQPHMRIEHNILDCINCSKYSVACTCSNI